MLKNLPHRLSLTARDLWSFLRQPTDSPAAEQSTKSKLQVLLQVLLFNILLSAALAGLIEGVGMLGWYNSDSHAVADIMRTLPAWGVLLIGVILAPLLEECIFRYGLRFKRGYVTFIYVALLSALAGFAFYLLPGVWAWAAALVLSVLLIMYVWKYDAIGDYLEQVWPTIYKAVFYAVALLFGAVHITNYTNFEYATAAVLLLPVLVAPQIMGGLLIGFMRVKYGFFWGYFLHAGHNAFFMVLALVFMDTIQEKLNINNESFTLKVEEHVRLNPTANTQSYFSNDSIAFENRKLDEVIVFLLQKEKACVQFGETRLQNRIINLSYKSHAADDAQNKETILAQLQELYKFEVTTSDFEQEIWNMEVGDSSMLANHITDGAGPSKITYTPEEITLENVTLNELLQAVNSEFDVVLSDKTTAAGKYNFKFAKKSFKNFREGLKNDYGLTMQPTTVLAEQAVIQFRK